MSLKHLSYGLVIALSLSATECIAMKKTSHSQEDVSESLEGKISAIKRRLKKVKEEQVLECKYNKIICQINYHRIYYKTEDIFRENHITRNIPELDISDNKLILLARERESLEAKLKELGVDPQDSREET